MPVPPAAGGAERFFDDAARALADRTEVSAHCLAPAGRPVPPGIQRHAYKLPPGAEGTRLALAPGLATAVWGADVLHLHQYGTLATHALALLARRLSIRVFVTDHGIGGIGLGARLGLHRFFDGFLPVSAFAAGGCPPDRTRVVPGAVDHQRFRPGARVAPAYALFTGRLFPHKGLDVLLRALPAGARLVIAGRPDEKAHPGYLDHLRGLVAGRDVAIELDVPDERLVDLYQGASALVLPTVSEDAAGRRYRLPELFGLTLVEGMACGTPVIASDAGALPEVVREGETGFVVPAGDPEALGAALATLLGNPARVETMGAAAREEVERRFTWDRVARDYLDAYRTLGPRPALPA